MSTIWSTQPLKTAYTLYFLLKTISIATICAIQYQFKPLRPVQGWSYQMSFGSMALRAYWDHLTSTRFQRPPQLTPGSSGNRFVLIDPVPTDIITGVMSTSTVLPAPVGAMWHPTPVLATDANIATRRVCIHAPGGALVLGCDLEETGKAAADVLTEDFDATNVLHISYRLASAESPFPAAIQDIISCYQYVLSLGVPSQNISLAGDSAGGNLMLAFLRYIETAQTVLPRPGSILVFSPWVDVTTTGVEEFERSPASKYDPLVAPLLSWGVNAYRPDDVSEEIEPYIAPRHYPFSTEIPLFINAGGKEGFLKSICEFAEGMSKVEGNNVMLHVSDKMPHDFFMLWPVLGTRNEVAVALKEARTFFSRQG
ncbi:alpha/beta hydrolase fold-3 domain-containing protein [Xylariaceae sp. FL1272]|nr:alpha/beta hydrolase fold-3 domain-containing protein [Xylariaceae sp. FL1272]